MLCPTLFSLWFLATLYPALCVFTVVPRYLVFRVMYRSVCLVMPSKIEDTVFVFMATFSSRATSRYSGQVPMLEVTCNKLPGWMRMYITYEGK